jgi:hypothetical protein
VLFPTVIGVSKAQWWSCKSAGRPSDYTVYKTARKYPRLLGFHGTLDSFGEPKINNVRWTDPAVLRQIVDIVGTGGRLFHDTSEHRFDVLPLLVATDAATAMYFALSSVRSVFLIFYPEWKGPALSPGLVPRALRIARPAVRDAQNRYVH